MIKAKIATIVALSMIGTAAFAKGPSFDYVDIAYTITTEDNQASVFDDVEVEGARLILSKELSHEFFTDFTYHLIDDEVKIANGDGIAVELKEMSVGLGYNHKVTVKTDIYAKVSFEMTEATALGLTNDETGYSISVGLRNKTASWLELSSEVKFKDVQEETETSLELGSRFEFTDMFSIGVGFSLQEDVEQVHVGMRFTF